MASASVTRSTTPPSRKAGNVGSLSGHAAQITALRTLLWSSGAAQPPRGTSRFPPTIPEEHGIEKPVPHLPGGPRAGPAQPPVHFHHQGEDLTPQGVPDPAPVQISGPGPLCPARRLPLRPLRLRRQRRTPPPPAAEAAAIRAGSALGAGGAGWCWGPRGWGGTRSPASGSMFQRWVWRRWWWWVWWAGICWMRGGMHRTGGTSGCGGASLPVPLSSLGPTPLAPAPRLSPWGHGALGLAFGSLPGPCTFVPFSAPWVLPPVTCALACTPGARTLPVPVSMPLAVPTLPTAPCSTPCAPWPPALAPCSPLRVSFLCTCPFPSPCPASCGPLPALCPPPLPLALVPCPRLRPRSLPCAPWSAPCVCPWPLCLSPPVLRSALPWPAHCPACVSSPPSQIMRRASCCRRGCGRVTPGGERFGAGGQTCRVHPMGKAALAGNGLGGLVWVRLGWVWARYFAPPATHCGCGGSRRGTRRPHHVGPPRPRHASRHGVADQGGGAARRGRSFNSLCTLPALLCGRYGPRRGAWGRRRGRPPRWRHAGGRGWGRGAACWGRGLNPRGARGPLWGRGGMARSLGGGGRLLGRRRSPGRRLGVSEAAWGSPPAARRAPLPPQAAAPRPRRGSPPRIPERERDRRWWRSSSWGEPSESGITVSLVGMRCGKCAHPNISPCICVVPWAVLCSAPQGGGGEGRGGWQWH